VPPIQLDWLTIKQAAMAAARNALNNVEAALPSLRDAGMASRIKTDLAEIEAKLSDKTVATENMSSPRN
jgi:hypothetical protein